MAVADRPRPIYRPGDFDNLVRALQVRLCIIERAYIRGVKLHDRLPGAGTGGATMAACKALEAGEHRRALDLACSIPGGFTLAAVIGTAIDPNTWEDGTPVEPEPDTWRE